jgi:hypothetical protein
MWNIFKKSDAPAEDNSLNELQEKLQEQGRESFMSESQKALMKSNLMVRIQKQEERFPMSLKRIEEDVRLLGREKFLGSHQKNMIFQAVSDRITEKAHSWTAIFWPLRNWRAGIASSLVFCLMLGVFVLAPIELRVTRASKWTFLEEVQGRVFVNRDGRVMSVDRDFSLQEGDLVFTTADSFVSIRYLDDSVTRLEANTSLEIKKLYVGPDNALKTQVELDLIGGRVWASVYNLVDNDAQFVIETTAARAGVHSRAVFSIDSIQDSTTLTVFDNVVDLSKKTSKVTYVQPVVAGFQAEVSASPFQVPVGDNGIVVKKSAGEHDQWVMTNLALDKKHQETLKEENLKFISSAVASDQTLGALADLKDSTGALFANADIEKARQRFLDAHVGFIKAQEYLEKAGSGNQYRRQATPLLLQYNTTLKEIMQEYPGLQQEDGSQAQELLGLMREETGLQKKALSLVMPGEKLYLAKEAVMDASSYFAINTAEKADYLLDRSKNRLLEMQNLIAKNNLKDAEAIFSAYLSGLDELVKQVEASKVTEIEGSLFELLNEQIKQFKLLTAIESELTGKGDRRFAALVGKVQTASLEKLIQIVREYRKNGIPFEMVMELKNTSEEFFNTSKEKSQLLADLDQVLSNYPEYAQLKASEQVSAKEVEQDSSVIVDFQASQDLGACLECTKK